MMQELITAGAAVDASRADGFRPIHCALHRGRKPREQALAAAQLLLKHGAEYTIYLAAVFGDAEFVRSTLKRDRSQANHTDTQWWRPITAAARRSDFEMVKLLLEHGADPNLPEDGAPVGEALWTAVYLDQPEMVKLLLEYGADPNLPEDGAHPRDVAEDVATHARPPGQRVGEVAQQDRHDHVAWHAADQAGRHDSTGGGAATGAGLAAPTSRKLIS